jgi:hypothetical protein
MQPNISTIDNNQFSNLYEIFYNSFECIGKNLLKEKEAAFIKINRINSKRRIIRWTVLLDTLQASYASF